MRRYEAEKVSRFFPQTLKLFRLSNEVFWVFVACAVFEKIEENRRSEIARSVIHVGKCIYINFFTFIEKFLLNVHFQT